MENLFEQHPTVLEDDAVLPEWDDQHLATVFSSAHAIIERAQQHTIGAIIAAAGVKSGFSVLDVGCGSGIPSLALAEAVGPTGSVIATDPSPVFLSACAANARERKLNNVQTVQSTAAGLPFEPGRFDAATCHMGVMFFPDVQAGLTRIRGVLRPGARAAFVAWGPDSRNSMFGAFWSAASSHLPPPPVVESEAGKAPEPSGPARFAEAGSLSKELRQAGFDDVLEESQTVELIWPGNAESNLDFWLRLTKIPERLSSEQLLLLRGDVIASMNRFANAEGLSYSADVIIASGRA